MSTFVGGGRKGGFSSDNLPHPETCLVSDARDLFQPDMHVVGDQCVVIYDDRDDWHPRYYRCDKPAKGAITATTHLRVVAGDLGGRYEDARVTFSVCGQHGRARYLMIEETRVREQVAARKAAELAARP